MVSCRKMTKPPLTTKPWLDSCLGVFKSNAMKLQFLRILIFTLFFSNALLAQNILWSDNFETYEGTGSIPPGFGGGMRVYSTHGTSSSKALCIQFSPFKQSDSTITPLIGPIVDGSVFTFDYRFAAYVGGVAFNGYTLNSDAIEVFIAPEGGEYGQAVLRIDASNHTSSLSFAQRSVNLDDYAGQSIRIKMKGVRGNSADYWFDTDNFQVSQANSIERPTVNDLSVFPNPSSEPTVTVNFDVPVHSVNIEVLNMLGAVVMKKQVVGQKAELDVHHLPRGVYYVKADLGSKKIIRKLVLK
jgi:hypothetical protein